MFWDLNEVIMRRKMMWQSLVWSSLHSSEETQALIKNTFLWYKMFRRHTFLMYLKRSKTRRNVCFYSCISWRWLFMIQAKREVHSLALQEETQSWIDRGKESRERKPAWRKRSLGRSASYRYIKKHYNKIMVYIIKGINSEDLIYLIPLLSFLFLCLLMILS